MREVTLIDTAVASTNLGDQIIMQACEKHLAPAFTDSFVYKTASHEWMGSKTRNLIKRSDHTIICGTNLLSSRMWFKPLWKIKPYEVISGLSVTLLGAGWYQHQSNADIYTKWLLKRALAKKGIHSVRDNYSKTQLMNAGIKNVVNTGCPTLWDLTPQHCKDIPTTKSDTVVTTLNTYIKNPELDRKLISELNNQYTNVHLWVQTHADFQYAKDLGSAVSFLKPSLASLDEILSTNVDYVGNRLHAGIRALQHKRRSIIIEVDNRAYEMGKDCSLPTVERDNFAKLNELITSDLKTQVTLPTEEIARWKAQFNNNE